MKLYIPDIREVAIKRPAGYLEEVLSSGRIENDIVLHLDNEVYRALVKKYAPAKPKPKVSTSIPEGAGTEVKRLLAKFKLNPAPGCKCNSRMNIMNKNGPDWCEQNIDTIVGWLREEADRANLMFNTIAAKLIVRRAIHNARKKEKYRQKQQAMLKG